MPPNLPQVIAHRGKTADPSHPHLSHLPENTLEAFTAAATHGADALETDLRISKDGVLVLCHDRSLERCFGVKRFVDECTWAELAVLRTLQAPHAPMPRLVDLLGWLASDAGKALWVLLDIKLDNLPERIMPLLAEAFAAVPCARWAERVVLGCWAGAYFPVCERDLPGYETALISFDVRYARRVLRASGASVNINQKVLMGMGGGMVEEAHAAGRRVFVWTVNEASLMRWSIAKGVDGVITDDPVRCRAIVRDVEKEVDGPAGRMDTVTVSQRAHAWALSLLVMMFGWVFRRKYLAKLEKRGKIE
ncbi:glycerophosphodiester phosphodiesterase [Aspergillus clavatus NRRL 1]|uniref:Glycerophosphoryl diester phosphodiesterase family protein n=1 Tax=Aspergillus clavatus (strain ATCC 1007 / CBS 513.65 / DSM 816 / NCTC 3887 / NRRL 1 / QM 1276 / 107) TaxID=344612 RepID=A1CFT3_ASPCL|nr:glycerophosphoryl diester phosphodiesterase family protein [Aspergillus clavatus NRRL 1]EAW11732.1 glycerophosphoryl diester phosphodiesterase family protein [Aspergillus clavatus NRRL 1]